MNIKYNQSMINLLNEIDHQKEHIVLNFANNVMLDNNGILLPTIGEEGEFDSFDMKTKDGYENLLDKYEQYYNSLRIDDDFFGRKTSLNDYINMGFLIAGKWLQQLSTDFKSNDFIFLMQYDQGDSDYNIERGIFIKCLTKSDYNKYFNAKTIHEINTPYIIISLS
ncbi:MAG: hypothetical protein GY828_05830 [Candidatus Gracilibacteria bacterium]|nr:hypothetical protein [Candidatus Gracilibacteria bacterium]